ncbi:Arc family DNA-binding protein [Commensalibacter papalotli (ex Servin-Garciduenas et al. 2014)]|uniref:Arc-like DNA binding domain-containing protein n=1 Tax=Commensalibacter papalotli (ex Servin-Garciduenas et al. 2014) TaxID=1208583 RepID=W7E6R5_9PROT|nr:hypothetical protein COMX_03720 [Commensalibacter papalotli (ex Servin-Garciduenas et al. 2014)]
MVYNIYHIILWEFIMDTKTTCHSIRLPIELKKWVKDKADEERRSLNSQFVYYIDQARKNEKKVVMNEN